MRFLFQLAGGMHGDILLIVLLLVVHLDTGTNEVSTSSLPGTHLLLARLDML
jgi:hypothetical protein